MNINDLEKVNELYSKLTRLKYSYELIEEQKDWLEEAFKIRGLYRIPMSAAIKTIMLDGYSRAIEETKNELRDLGVSIDGEPGGDTTK